MKPFSFPFISYCGLIVNPSDLCGDIPTRSPSRSHVPTFPSPLINQLKTTCRSRAHPSIEASDKNNTRNRMCSDISRC